MCRDVSQALDDCFARFVSFVPQAERVIEYDPEWPSECCNQSSLKEGMVEWQPVRQQTPLSFDGMEQALELEIHPDVKAFYSRYWSDNLLAQAEQGQLELLQVWNQADFERLQQNLIGHILMKRRLRQPETLFIGLTDEEDFILTVDNQTGEVYLEQVGRLPCKTLSKNLATLIKALRFEN